MIVTVLSGHTSPETAYLVSDYPYGFTLRCKIRYWLETKPRHGMRFMSQTTNPKRAGDVWNKPKASTYSPLAVMGLDEIGHVVWTGLGVYADEAKVDAFATNYAAALTSEYAGKMVALLRAVAKRETVRKAAADAAFAAMEVSNVS